MRVVISTSPLSNSSKTRGVGVYARELIDALRRSYPDDTFLTADRHCYRQGADLVHFPFFDPFFLTLPLYKPAPTVVTIHDVIPLRFPEHFPRGKKGGLKLRLQRFSLQSAAHVITDSQASAADLNNYLGVDAGKISVVPLAPASSRATVTLADTVKKEYRLPRRYLLYVGDVNWNKNLPGLINAFSALNSPSLHLLLVGKVFSDAPDIPEYRELLSAIESSQAATRIRLVGYVPTHHLPYFYQHATLYVQPSWYEGFGLPVLEAMRHSCPVAASDRGSLPEVGGPAAAYFDPGKPRQMVNIIDSLLKDPLRKRELVEIGKKQARRFTWENTARQTYAVYQKILKH